MKQVVLVEDEHALRETLVELMEILGYEVAAFPSLSAARELIMGSGSELVICDWLLPNENPLEFCLELKNTSPQTKFIVMTGFGDEEKRTQTLAHGADKYVVKPVSVSELEKILKEYVQTLTDKR